MFEPQPAVVLARPFADDLREQSLQLARRQPGIAGELRYAHGPVECSVEELHGLGQRRMVDALACRGQHALRQVARAHMVVQAVFGDAVGQMLPMVGGDGVQHHVDGGGAARAGQASRANFEQGLRHHDCWKPFAEGIDHFPVHGDTVAVQQPGTREQKAASVEGSQ